MLIYMKRHYACVQILITSIYVAMYLRFLPQAPCFTLPLKQAQNIAFTAWSFNVTDDGTVQVIKKSYAHLGYITSVTGSSENFINLLVYEEGNFG